MLNRQKTLLHLLVSASRPVSKMEMTKWAFLLREELPSKGGSAFYDFLPYKYGPFSFCLYREMDTLVRDGYVELTDDNHWKSTALAAEKAETIPQRVRTDGRRVVDRFGEMTANRVVDYVYDRYPRFTVNSERKQLAPRPVAAPAVFTAGYERLSVDAFLNRLVNRGIQRIVDVRNNPIARRYGFHKSTLSRLAGRLQIEYVHIPELGIASKLRRNLKSHDDYEKLFDRYEATTLRNENPAVDRVADLVKESPSVLVCMEADPVSCHRTRLARLVAEKTGLKIEDLGGCCL